MISGEVDLIILLLGTDKELSILISTRDFISNSRIILILQDDHPKTVQEGHKLYPRYLSCDSEDFSDVVAVLGKLLNKNN